MGMGSSWLEPATEVFQSLESTLASSRLEIHTMKVRHVMQGHSRAGAIRIIGTPLLPWSWCCSRDVRHHQRRDLHKSKVLGD